MTEEDIQTEIKNVGNGGGIVIVTVGSVETPATRDDMERVADTVNETMGELIDVRVLIVPHLVKVDMIPIKDFLKKG